MIVIRIWEIPECHETPVVKTCED